MPFAPLAAVVVPKAGAAIASALAVGSDDLAHHAHDLGQLVQHANEHATAFIHLSIPKQRIFNMIVGPEIAAYHWAQAKAHAVYDTMFGVAAIPDEQHGRMVEYFAAGCPHCKTLDPVWKEAEGLWAKQGGEDAKHLVWEQKQCLDDNWKPGADFQECQAQNVSRFPTIKFFAPGSKTGEDFFLERSPEQLVDFAKTGIHPSPDVMARAPGDQADMKFVDFYAAACPHCKHLDPVWDDAHKQWDQATGQTEGHQRDDLPLLTFEKKECYDDHWKPGPDSEICQKFHVNSFPTIKLLVPDPHGHGFQATDYEGDRTPEGMVNFLKEATTKLTGEPVVPPPAVHDALNGVPAGIKIPDAVRAEALMADGVHVPEAVKAAAAAHAASHEDESALQGDTPQGEALPKALAEAVKTATMPVALLPVISCLPVRRSRTTATKQAKPPAARAQFI